MKLIIVIVTLVTTGHEAKFVLKEVGFRSMVECEEIAAHGPRDVCAEVPAFYLKGIVYVTAINKQTPI